MKKIIVPKNCDKRGIKLEKDFHQFSKQINVVRNVDKN